MEETKKDPVYIGIDNPLALRKDILTCSRDIIHSLRKYEDIKELRVAKIEYLYQFKKVMEELVILNSKLKKVLPSAPKRKKPKIEQIVQGKKKNHIVKKERSKLNVLEDELGKIEDKLKRLK